MSVVNSNSARLNRKQISLPVSSFLEALADRGLGHNTPDVSVLHLYYENLVKKLKPFFSGRMGLQYEGN